MTTIYHSGTVLTMDGGPDDGPDAPECVVTDGARIVYVGGHARARELYGAGCDEIDLQGRVLMPAFIDAHGHFMNFGMAARQVDLRECGSIDEIVAALAAALADRPAGDAAPVVGVGYDHNNLPGYRHPTRHDLDRVSTGVPVVAVHRSSHMGVVNSAALAHVGITATTPDPVGGRFGREADGATPDGYVEEISALMIVAEGLADGARPSLLMPGARTDQRDAIRTAQDGYLARGITTVQEGAAAPEEVDALIAAGVDGDLVVDVVAYPIVTAGGLDVLDAHPERVGAYEGHVRLGGCKMILDGSPQARSAWLSRPYEVEGEAAQDAVVAGDAGTHDHGPGQCCCGYPSLPDDEVEDFIARAVDSGYQVLAHCNGDAASEQFLTAYAAVAADRTEAAALRPVMIHAQTVRDDQLDRMPALGMVASFFVGHVWFWGDTHLRNLGDDRGRRISPVRSALDRGVRVTLHQDAPVTDPDMPVSLAAATTRRSCRGTVVGPEQAVSRYEALRAVTAGSAYQYGEETDKGRIRTGLRADLIVVDRNPLTCADEDLQGLTVLRTVKDGTTVFTRQEHP
jgi:predicted amidohydrolase YtcJ